MKTIKKLIFSLFIVTIAFAQSGPEYRRSAVHNANLVRTVFGNWGVVGQPSGGGPRGAWLYDTNGYIGDISPIVGAEVSYYDSELDSNLTFNSVVVCPVSRPASGQEESNAGKLWTFEPVGSYLNAISSTIAMSTNPSSWPLSWPDKSNDSEDPGWTGSWNGYFGKNIFSADQESFYVMDDNNDEEYNERTNTAGRWTGFPGYEFKPDATDPSRNGLGLEVKVRGMQWQQFLASDVIFWLYEVTNTSTTDYSKVAFGMVCGTYLGVTGNDDSHGEYDDDWSFFDVENDITYTGDFDESCARNPKWQGPVGMVGYAFLESPGNQYDGIDNDGDNSIEVYPNLSFSAPKFTKEDFDPVIYNMGDQVVVIDEDYNRSLETITSNPQVIHTRGASITIIPGVTELVEGNTIDQFYNVNQNVYDGIDNDLDGLIDENYIYHYRQIRMKREADKYDVDHDGNTTELINVILYDKLNPVTHIDYINNLGIDDPLIDERRDDGIDNNGDWDVDYDDVGADGRYGTNDIGEGDGIPTTGEPNFDGTDVDESDQIGLSSFNYFTPSNEYPMKDDDKLWDWLKPGYFDLPTNIQNGEPVAGEDGDFIYGSGYFPLRAGETQRFSLALVYGNDLNDLYKNRQTVQKIYDYNYRFAFPPDKPKLSAVPGDGKITLYWDRLAEDSIDPLSKEKDFEGYKIYKATDPNFNESYSITDANGVVTGYKALTQFDLKNNISGLFEPTSEMFQETDGYSINLGSNTGLQHSYVDEDVVNGKRYYYALVSYDKGDASEEIFPSENTKFISIQPDGTVITDINTCMVRPQPEVAGYDGLNSDLSLYHNDGPATGSISYEVLDETKLTDHTYRVTFTDSRSDSIDNNDNGLFDDEDEYEYSSKTSSYSVMDVTGYTETIELDTLLVYLENKNLIYNSILISKSNFPDDYLDLDEFIIDTLKGQIKLVNYDVYDSGYFTLNYQYYPVYKSPNIFGSPYSSETKDSDIFDGIQLAFDNDWRLELDETSINWNNTENRTMDITIGTLESSFGADTITGIPYAADYEIHFTDSSVTGYITPATLIANVYSTIPSFTRPRPVKTNFYLYNKTDEEMVPFIFAGGKVNSDGIYELSNGAVLSTFFYLPGDTDSLNANYSWVMNIISQNTVRPRFHSGDILSFNVKKPFRNGDMFEFTTEAPEVDSDVATNSLDNIQVVPNPYIVANNMEAPLPPAVTSGRGERRIEFRKLPTDAKVYIFTSAGSLVKTLNHGGDIHNGTLAWDLKTSENLDIAFGVYFYVIESSAGKKSGKVAVIK
ncbi:MAG: hypothetical protein K9N05_07195 [Candidatus Marinimicrobia bacterium]|nr:hypothetical protein [Candidatus Neomarinimicrobiota bacterium]